MIHWYLSLPLFWQAMIACGVVGFLIRPVIEIVQFIRAYRSEARKELTAKRKIAE